MAALINSQLFSDARVAHRRAVAFHLYDPNVTLVDVGWKIKESEGNKIYAGDLRVRVHVRRKLQGAALESLDALRFVDPARIGFPCDVIESTYPLHAAAVLAPMDTSTTPPMIERLPRTARLRPLRGGASGDRIYGTAATFGGFVLDRQTGVKMVLSNFHVLAGSVWARPGQPSYQPSPLDGGSAASDTAATLVRDAMLSSMDAAVARLSDGVDGVNDQIGLGPVTGLAEPQLGMLVTKSGRTTGVTAGMIGGVLGQSVAMNYGAYPTVIRNICHIGPAPAGGPVSDGGDSGSWWLDQATNCVVALHFAGTPAWADEDYALAISMPKVLDSLNVDLAI